MKTIFGYIRAILGVTLEYMIIDENGEVVSFGVVCRFTSLSAYLEVFNYDYKMAKMKHPGRRLHLSVRRI